MVVWALGSAVGLLVDDRVLTGAPIWAKPFKFSVSFVAYCLSLAWMISLLDEAGPRLRRTVWWAATVVVAASAVEMVLMTLQVLRGVRSHFNGATPFDTQVYSLMGNTVVVLWLGTLVVAALLWRARIADRATAWSIRISTVLALTGAGLAFLMTLPTAEQQRLDAAGVEVLERGGHSVGVPDGGPGMLLTGWSTTGGDLRIPHFFGMHALQLLPLLVLVLTALAPRSRRLRDERVRVRLVFVSGAVYAAVLALLTWQALRGEPLVHPGTATLGAGALILAGGGLDE
ncbi:hypothetical protein [Streptomyces sp. NRRL F-2580]|uniref:hypothetical protein n=1 Tax=Streptomyces sp. NRRL F-2580 TaxID=1463841 RepID=UPI001F16E30E|nr:hypothetical protein [Streptomyces sp. NRRL F-2580]